MNTSNIIYRKLLAGFLTICTFTFGTTLVFIFGFDAYESLREGVIGISLIVAFYATPVILLYGVPVSLIIEYIFTKKMIVSNLLYIGLHTLFGMAGYFMFWEWGGVYYGFIAAFIFAIVDRVLSRYKMTDTFIVVSVVLPIGLYTLFTLLMAAFG